MTHEPPRAHHVTVAGRNFAANEAATAWKSILPSEAVTQTDTEPVPGSATILECCTHNESLEAAATHIVESGGCVLVNDALSPWRQLLERRKAVSVPQVHVWDNLASHPLIQRAGSEFPTQLGRFQHIRIRTLLGGSNSAEGAEAVERLKYLSDTPFEHPVWHPVFPLVETIMGPVSDLMCYGSQNTYHVALNFVQAGRQGLLEFISAPDIRINGERRDRVFEMEVSGPDGIGWVRNLRGFLTEAPRYQYKRKDVLTTIDSRESDRPDAVNAALRRRLLEGKSALQSVSKVLRGLHLAGAAIQSLETGRRISVSE